MKNKLIALLLLPLLAFGHWALDFDEEFAAATTGKKAKLPYITDGLITMWDGEWNAGFGVHDPEATVWKDIVGNNDLANTGMTMAGVAAKSFVFSNGVKMGLANFTALYDLVIAKTFTYEVVAKITDKASVNASLGGLGYSWSRTLWIFANATTTIVGDEMQGNVPYGEGTLNSPYSFSVSGEKKVYANGDLSGDISNATQRRYTYNPFSVGALPGFNDYMIGEIYCIRVYNRNLSAEEIAQNHAIDKARFGL